MPTRKDHKAACRAAPGMGRELVTTPVTEAESLDQLLEHSLPSFGGAYLRRVWTLLDECVGKGLPMTVSIAGTLVQVELLDHFITFGG